VPLSLWEISCNIPLAHKANSSHVAV